MRGHGRRGRIRGFFPDLTTDNALSVPRPSRGKNVDVNLWVWAVAGRSDLVIESARKPDGSESVSWLGFERGGPTATDRRLHLGMCGYCRRTDTSIEELQLNCCGKYISVVVRAEKDRDSAGKLRPKVDVQFA